MASYTPAFNPDLSITELDHSGGLLMAAIRLARASEAPRTGLHCSTIVDDILRTMYPKKYERELADQHKFSFQEFGNVWEDICAQVLIARHPHWVKPGEGIFRRIKYNADGWDSATRTIDEIKATWASEKEFLDSVKLHGYTMQALFYALAKKARRVRFHVFFVNGLYPYGAPRPNCRTFIVRWADGGLERNYNVLHQHAKDRKMYTQ